jgi:hypothetical protein
MTQLHIALHGATSYLSNPWAFGVNVGRAALLLRPDVQRQLLLGRDELGFHHVRFGGVFDDALGVLRPDGAYDFSQLEQVFDWLMENGLSPFVVLAGVPAGLATPPGVATATGSAGGAAASPGRPATGTGDHSATPVGDPVTAADLPAEPASSPATDPPLPFDAGRWVELVRALAAFVDGRYGCDAQEWHFEVWPGADDPARWPVGRDAYLRLYDQTATAVKSVNRQFKVGGPAAADSTWAAAFVDHVAKPLDVTRPTAAADAVAAAATPDGSMTPDGPADPDGVAGDVRAAGDVSAPTEAGVPVDAVPAGGDGSAGDAAPVGVRCDFVTVTGSAADPAALADHVAAVRQAVTAALGESTPVLLAAWTLGDADGAPDPGHDRFAAGAAVAAAAAAVADHVAGAMYAAITDVDDAGLPGGSGSPANAAAPAGRAAPAGVRFEPFHGGAGLVSVNDVRKASFNVFKFLNEHLGYKADWHWVEPTPGLSVLVSRDYHHVVRILAAYHAPPTAKAARFTIEGLPASVKYGQVQVIRGGVGSPLETWVERGRPVFVNKWLLEDLETAAHPLTMEVNFHEFPPRLEPGMTLQLSIPMPDDVAGMD